MILDQKQLQYILYGTALLGSGGGGTIKAGKKFIDQVGNTQVTLITEITKKNADLLACVICDIGSITAFDDNQAEALDIAFNSLQEAFSTKLGSVDVLFPIETGPENILAPFVLAAKYNLPVFDGDGAARAIPTLPLCTFLETPINNAQPVAMSNGKGDHLLVSTKYAVNFEGLLRILASTTTFASSASLALWPNPLKTLAKKSIQGSVTRALYCGQLLEAIREKNRDLIKQSKPHVNKLNAYLIAKGEVVFKNSAESNAFNYTTTKIENELDNAVVTILSQNESLIVYNNKSFAPIAMAPDSICYLNYDFWPLTNAEIEEVASPEQGSKQYVYVIGIKAHPKLKTPKMAEGFKNIIEELGYAGDLKIKTPKASPLGDFLINLKK